MLLLFAVNAVSHSSHLPPSYPALEDVWKSPVPYVLLLTLVIILLTAIVLHFLSTSDSPLTPLHKYKFRHDGYLSLSPTRCAIPSSATLTSFTSPSTHRTLRVLRLLPIPRPGNALPSPVTPRAVLIWLPPLHSHLTHSTSLLSHAAYTGHTTLALDWMQQGGGYLLDVAVSGGGSAGVHCEDDEGMACYPPSSWAGSRSEPHSHWPLPSATPGCTQGWSAQEAQAVWTEEVGGRCTDTDTDTVCACGRCCWLLLSSCQYIR